MLENLLGLSLSLRNFFEVSALLDVNIVRSSNPVQYQAKLMTQTWENGKIDEIM